MHRLTTYYSPWIYIHKVYMAPYRSLGLVWTLPWGWRGVGWQQLTVIPELRGNIARRSSYGPPNDRDCGMTIEEMAWSLFTKIEVASYLVSKNSSSSSEEYWSD
jgi:hypothetical protein